MTTDNGCRPANITPRCQDGHDLDASSPTVIRGTAASSREPNRAAAARPPSRGSGDGHSTGDLPVAFPVGPLAGQEGIIRCRLLVAVDVERPRGDGVGTRGRSAPVELPERPGELGRLPLLWLVALEPGLHPGAVVDSNPPP